MECRGISNSSNCHKLALAVGIASLCTLIAVAVLFRHQIPSIARKFGALYTDAPLKIQLPIVASSAAIATFIVATSTYLCYQRMQPKLPAVLEDPGCENNFN